MQDNLKKNTSRTSKNIAILGLSPDSTKTSHQVAKYLLQKGFNIIPIYPKGGEILGKRAYHSLQEAFSEESIKKNGEIEILNIFRKSEALEGIAKEIIKLPNKPKCVWIQLGLQSQEAKSILEQNNLLYIENICIKLEYERLCLMIALAKFIDAKKRLEGISQHTKLAFAPKLSQISQSQVYVKQENLQNTGSFKLRGAFNKISTLTPSQRAKGVIAASAGNHAQGVAYSAKHYGIKAVIVMPEATPLLKVMGVKELGAEAILYGNNYDEAYAYAINYAKENELHFIHPFSDDEVIAGQGTIALEMIEDQNNLTTIVVPVGGGGLISGIASVYKQMLPNTRIIGVVAKGAPGMHHSFYQKSIQSTKDVRTIADGIAVRDVNEKNFHYILESVDEIVMVDDEEIANAILYLLEKQKLVVEGAGASVVAALLHHKFTIKEKESVGLVLSGGNIDVNMLGVIIEKGLVRSHRKMSFSVTLIDKPGSLERLSNLLSNLQANIVKVDFDRVSASLVYGDANISVRLETKGAEHQEQIRKALLLNGYKFTES